jgi:hypothetical protein
MEVPKSSWIVNKVYFEVTLVDNFKEKYLEWLRKYEGAESVKQLWDNDTGDLLLRFLQRVCNRPTMEVYQFPCDVHYHSSADHLQDYFERQDDNHVIPFELFTITK